MGRLSNPIWLLVGVLFCIALIIWIVANVSIG
jgi:hypothetical protein